jgi:hypothetical protein
MKIILDKSRKKKSIIDEVIVLSKLELEKLESQQILSEKKEIKFFETLPFGKELKQAFEIMSLRKGKEFSNANEWYKTSMLKSFMFHFYKTLFISIDKNLKQSNDIGFRDLKNAFYIPENIVELKKALNIFNVKNKSQYYEFSKNGLIELYTQTESLNLKNFLKLSSKDAEAQKPKTTSLKPDSKSIKTYREIIRRTLLAKLSGIKYSEAREDITVVHIMDVADEIGEEYKRLENRYYKWAQRHPDRIRILAENELNKILQNQPA